MTPATPLFTLRRLASTDFATHGILTDAEDKEIAKTLELPWCDNQPNVSCIPPGTYTAHRRTHNTTSRTYDVFELEGVPNRSHIEIHIGNVVSDTEGCVLLGSNFGPVNGQSGITGSARAFARFMDGLRGVDRITITVLDAPTNA